VGASVGLVRAQSANFARGKQQMSPEEAKQLIVNQITVTRQRVTIAKAFILKNFDANTLNVIERFAGSVNAKMPQTIVLHATVDPTPILNAAAEAISWKLAACEAIWGLISTGAVFPASMTLCGEIGGLGWTTVVGKSGGASSGFSFDELSILVPSRLAFPRSSDSANVQPLTDPDLYLKELDLTELHSAIETALREAVRCFRHELYLACLAMLGRASEAAWIETGLAIVAAAPGGSSIDAGKINDQLQNPFLGIGKKIQIVNDLFSRQNIYCNLSKASGVKSQDLKNCVIWADCVRESRNSIHYGAKPAMSNSYEKVAALLIGAVPHIRLLATLTKAANEQAASATPDAR
jgi:hypothetical protein